MTPGHSQLAQVRQFRRSTSVEGPGRGQAAPLGDGAFVNKRGLRAGGR